MNHLILSEVKEFLRFRLKKFQRLLDLDEQIEMLLKEGEWGNYEQVIVEKTKIVTVLAEQEEKVLSLIKKSEPTFQHQDIDWQVIYKNLSEEEKGVLGLYFDETRKVLTQIQKKEEQIKVEIQLEQNKLSQQMGQIKKSKQAHNAYQQSSKDAVFFNRRR